MTSCHKLEPYLFDVYCRGAMDVKMAPKALSLREETELQAMLDRLALEQEDEIEGDDETQG